MDAVLFSGLFDLSWWQHLIVALALTHVTIVCVTVFLHRCQTHRALELHPVLSHFFRLWLWLTTGMATREWVAIHRKHHARCETAEDPHSPQVLGINRVLWGGVFLYVKESHKPETIERFGHGTPDDWLERTLYSRYVLLGLTLTGVANVVLFGIVPGVLILVAQLVWIPFWAAGVINGVGHYWGYRNFPTPDASTNMAHWGLLIGGEELHNNHHAFPSSAKFSCKPGEFDLGWMYIRLFEALGLARVKKLAPVPQFAAAKPAIDVATMQAVLANRYDVLAGYAGALRPTSTVELGAMEQLGDAGVKRWLQHNETALPEAERARLIEILSRSLILYKVVWMRAQLVALWERSAASKEQLVRQLQGWCESAEASGIPPLAAFSRRLRCYA
ncbi:MAG: acyl-CoA desaturase [Betaproteobacteria bacterium]|nr:acyl-CoA desaturase [Betaproteobacteria bacterium]